nr:hypothetical protein [Helicobacter winghamensis]
MEFEQGIQLLSTADKLGIVGVLFGVIGLSAIFNYWLIRHMLSNCNNMQKIQDLITEVTNLLKANHTLQKETIDLLKGFSERESATIKELVGQKITSQYNDLSSDLNRLTLDIERLTKDVEELLKEHKTKGAKCEI